MAFSLQARIICPVDRPPIEYGAITIEGERIVSVGTGPVDGDVADLGPVALLPGLVNAHTHLEFSHLQKPLGKAGMRLPDWIRLVIAERASRFADPARAIAAGIDESLSHGVTTVADVSTADIDTYPVKPLAELMLYIEVIGFSRARAVSAFASLGERLDQLSSAAQAYSMGISPHAPYTVSPGLLHQLIRLATTRNLPVAMHLAESLEEIELLQKGSGPFQELLDERSMWDASAIPASSRPLDYLKLLSRAPRALVIHGNYLDAEEHNFMAAHRDRLSLVYCPRTHDYFRHRPYPLRTLWSAGIRVALGTDSRASNPDLNLLAEMQRVVQQHPEIDPAAVLRMGTLAGAEALGRADELGSLTPGKLANLVAIPLAQRAGENAEDLLAGVLAGESAVGAVWYRGQNI